MLDIERVFDQSKWNDKKSVRSVAVVGDRAKIQLYNDKKENIQEVVADINSEDGHEIYDIDFNSHTVIIRVEV